MLEVSGSTFGSCVKRSVIVEVGFKLSMNNIPLYSGKLNRSRREDLTAALSAAQLGYESVAICRFCAQFYGVYLGKRFDEEEEKKKDIRRAKEIIKQYHRRQQEEEHQQQHQVPNQDEKGSTMTAQQHQRDFNNHVENIVLSHNFKPGFVDEDVERENTSVSK